MCSFPLNRRVCGGCNQEIMYGNCLGCMDTYFHPNCFRCHSCGYPITEREVVWPSLIFLGDVKIISYLFNHLLLFSFFCWSKFSLSGKHPYHKSCFKELTHPKCEVCFQFVRLVCLSLIKLFFFIIDFLYLRLLNFSLFHIP